MLRHRAGGDRAPPPARGVGLQSAGFAEWGKQRRLRLYDKMRAGESEQAARLREVAGGGGVAALTRMAHEVESLVSLDYLSPDFVYRVGIALHIKPLENIGEAHMQAELRDRVSRRLFIDALFRLYCAYITELGTVCSETPFLGVDYDAARCILSYLPHSALPELRLVCRSAYGLATGALAAHPLVDVSLVDALAGGEAIEAGDEWYTLLGDALLPHARSVLGHMYRRHRREAAAVRAADEAVRIRLPGAPAGGDNDAFDVAAVIPASPLVPLFGFTARILHDLRLHQEIPRWGAQLVAFWQTAHSTPAASLRVVLESVLWLCSFEIMEPAARALTDSVLAAPWVREQIEDYLAAPGAHAVPEYGFGDAPLDEHIGTYTMAASPGAGDAGINSSTRTTDGTAAGPPTGGNPLELTPTRALGVGAHAEEMAEGEEELDVLSAVCGSMVGVGVPTRLARPAAAAGPTGIDDIPEAVRERTLAQVFARSLVVKDTAALAGYLGHDEGVRIINARFDAIVDACGGDLTALLCAAVKRGNTKLVDHVLAASWGGHADPHAPGVPGGGGLPFHLDSDADSDDIDAAAAAAACVDRNGGESATGLGSTCLTAPDSHGRTPMWYWADAGADALMLQRLAPLCRAAQPNPLFRRPAGGKAPVTILMDMVLKEARAGAGGARAASVLQQLLDEKLIAGPYPLYVCVEALHTCKPAHVSRILDVFTLLLHSTHGVATVALPHDLVPPHLPPHLPEVVAACGNSGCLRYGDDSELSSAHCCVLATMETVAELIQERVDGENGAGQEEEDVVDDWEAYA